jgi:hypothetical protein
MEGRTLGIPSERRVRRRNNNPKKNPTLSGGGTLPAIEELENEIQRNISAFEMCTQTGTSQKKKINELCSYSFHICICNKRTGGTYTKP